MGKTEILCRGFSKATIAVFVTANFSWWLWAEFSPVSAKDKDFPLSLDGHTELVFLQMKGTLLFLFFLGDSKIYWKKFVCLFVWSCAEVRVNWPKIYYGYLTWRSLHILGGMSPSMKEWYPPAKHPQVLGWHFVNYICYFIDLMFMPWQCSAVGLRGLGVQFHAKSELQPKVLPSALCHG